MFSMAMRNVNAAVSGDLLNTLKLLMNRQSITIEDAMEWDISLFRVVPLFLCMGRSLLDGCMIYRVHLRPASVE